MSAHDWRSTAGAQPYFQKGTTRIIERCRFDEPRTYDHNRPNSSTREAMVINASSPKVTGGGEWSAGGQNHQQASAQT